MSLVSVVAIIIAVGLLSLGLWNLFGNNKANKRRKQRQRRSDSIKLTPQQKKMYVEARKLYKNGNLRASAKILESLGMIREAVNLFEKGQLIHEAADVLLRIHRPNRAGVIYVRHGFWKEAMECFKKANMPKDVARCARKIGELSTAVVYFLEAKEYKCAAECYEDLGKHREAAKIFIKMGMYDKAIQQYNIFLDKQPNLEGIEFNESEIKVIINYIISGHGDTRLAEILVVRERVTEVILGLIRKGDIEKAKQIYQKTTFDVGPSLIGHEDSQDEDNRGLGEMFGSAGAYEYCGMVFERLGDFVRAAEAFKMQENFERAAYCYDRAGLKVQVTQMRIEIAKRGPTGKTPINQISPTNHVNNPFKMEETASRELNHHNANGGGDLDSELQEKVEELEDTDREGPALPALSLADVESSYNLAEMDIEDEVNRLEIPGLKQHSEQPSYPSSAPIFSTASPPGFSKPVIPSVSRSGNEVALNIGQSPMESELDQRYWAGLHDSKFLADLTKEQQNLFKEIGDIREFQINEYILDYEDEPLGLYFILKGKIGVFKRINGIDTEIDTMESPETIGQLWLLVDRPSKVKFVAREQCRLFSVKRADFMGLLDNNGTIARKVYKRFTMTLLQKLLNIQNEKEKLEIS